MTINPDEQDMDTYIQRTRRMLEDLEPVSEWDEVHGTPVLVPVPEVDDDT